MKKVQKLWISLQSPPQGWLWAKSVEEAKAILLRNRVDYAAIEYNLGYLPPPRAGHSCRPDRRKMESGQVFVWKCRLNCSCSCHDMAPTGIDLIHWMWKTSTWPRKIHMLGDNLIARHWAYTIINTYGQKLDRKGLKLL